MVGGHRITDLHRIFDLTAVFDARGQKDWFIFTNRLSFQHSPYLLRTLNMCVSDMLVSC